jgi:guanidinopropionase
MTIDPYAERETIPVLYGDVPTFLGLPRLDASPSTGEFPDSLAKTDAVIFGVPWEGALTWGSYNGCEYAPREIRKASLRYGSWMPEHDVDFTDRLRVADAGDVAVDLTSVQAGFGRARRLVEQVVKAGATPIALGGDHSITIPLVEGLGQRYSRLGVVVLDAHLDNADEFRGDRYARCCPFARIPEMPHVDGRNLVQIGIRGPRNGRNQMDTAREMGATVFTSREIQSQGLASVVETALEIATDGTDGFYLSVDSDVLDSAFNPGGPIDHGGISSRELLDTVFRFGQAGAVGADIVEIHPQADPQGYSAHLAAWTVIYFLCGLAAFRGSE